MKSLLVFVLGIFFISCNSKAQDKKEASTSFPIMKTESEWRSELSEIEYYVLREKGTERAFSSEFNTNNQKGTYVCAGCGTPLFI